MIKTSNTTALTGPAGPIDLVGPPGSVRIVSKRKGGTMALPDETIVDVDRSNATLGNWHFLKNHLDKAERARVIDAYAKDFAADVACDGPMSLMVARLAGRVMKGENLALSCWCAPSPCHAAVLRDKILELAGIQKNADHDTHDTPDSKQTLALQDSLFSF